MYHAILNELADMCRDFATHVNHVNSVIVIFGKYSRMVAIISCCNGKIRLRVANGYDGIHVVSTIENPTTSFDSIVNCIREAYIRGYTMYY